ncbi:hypothetical protein [Arthrobacter sp. SDTb3-6]|uniref:hypothetical protein n=1 Tax=Arthrobacter sp. SDTb3-6 TaxID=2713571 RepID=UPI00159D6C22|nr:hypothetical protein [Arthrobacter sp. SDTb3-6]NVM98140.1 hypothetical protein [Arthrobacter sp. SDTb3-6]
MPGFHGARNLVIDGWRNARRRHCFGTDQLPEVPSAGHTDRVVDAGLVGDVLEAPSTEHREVIQLAYYAGAETAAIAMALDLLAGTVKSRLHCGEPVMDASGDSVL